MCTRGAGARVTSACHNLLSNAIKFTPAGGQVTVRSESLGPHIRISITDTGAGIAADDLPRLFTPFTQLANAKEKSGTGLGLALTKALVELMGGQIGVTSTPGTGSTFYIELRRAENALPIAPATVAPAAPMTAPLALVIEDDEQSVELLVPVLQSHGYRTMVAARGEEVLTLARRHQPQVITLDLFLPTIDGWDVLRVLRTDPSTAEIPIVMVTISSDRHTAFALRAVEHLVKPIDQKSLLQVLRRLSFTTATTQQQARVLVVDDDPQQLELSRAALEPHGFVVRTESSGRAGLEAALSSPVDVLLLDLVMPDLSGIEVIDALRASDAGSKIPIVLITGHDITPSVRARLKGEVEAILAKDATSTHELLDQILRSLKS